MDRDLESEKEEDVVHAKMCIIEEEIIKAKGEWDVPVTNSPFSLLCNNLYSNISMDGFTTEELQQCSLYEVGLRTTANGKPHQL